jgi:hypothetical protein
MMSTRTYVSLMTKHHAGDLRNVTASADDGRLVPFWDLPLPIPGSSAAVEPVPEPPAIRWLGYVEDRSNRSGPVNGGYRYVIGARGFLVRSRWLVPLVWWYLIRVCWRNHLQWRDAP